MSLVELKDFGVAIEGATLLHGIDLAMAPGQRVGIIGMTGSGKSVLARAAAGRLPEQAVLSGRSTLSLPATPGDADGGAPPPSFSRAAVLLGADAADSLDPLRSIGAQLRSVLAEPASADQTGDLLRDVGLVPGDATRYPADLTVAQRRLAAIAIALASRPALLVADEPTAGLDAVSQRVIADLIDRHCREHGMALLLVSHELRLIAMLCDTVLVMQAGRIVEAATKADVLGQPRHEASRALLAAGRQRGRTLMRAPIGADLLMVRGVSRRFRLPDRSIVEPGRPVLALDDVGLTLRAGEALALIGRSGAGKTVLARIVAGLERATKGQVQLDHETYRGLDMPRPIRSQIGFVFPDPHTAFDPALTVGESVAAPLALDQQLEFDELGQRLLEVVRAVGLPPDLLNRLPHELGAAELQRFAIARALINHPRLIVLDEPLAALDIVGRGEIVALLSRLRADYGLTFLIATQDLDLVQIVADRALVMERGRIVDSGPPVQLFENPQHDATRALAMARLPEIGIVPVLQP